MAAGQVSGVAEQVGSVLRGVGTQTIGALVFWTLSGVHIDRQLFRQSFESIGMGAAVPRDPRAATLLTTAVADLKVGKADVIVRRSGKGWAIVLEAQGQVEVSCRACKRVARFPRLTERPTFCGQCGARGSELVVRDETAVLKHTHVATVHADEHPDQVNTARAKHPERLAPELVWKFQGTPAQVGRAQVLAQEVEQSFHEAKHFLSTADLSTVLSSLMHGTSKDTLLAAVSLRQSTGGLYFVHASKVAATEQVRDLLRSLAPQCSLIVMTITGEAENLEQAAQAAKLGFASQLAELRTEVQKFLAETPKDGVSERSIEVRVARYRTLSARVSLFSDILGTVAGELEAQIDAARQDLEKEVGLS